MKTLQTLALVSKNTSIGILLNTVYTNNQIHIDISENVENAIEQMQMNKYQMLLVDKELPLEVINKINSISEILFPKAAVVNLFLNDTEFVHFKINEMLSKWNKANEESAINFFDNPKLDVRHKI